MSNKQQYDFKGFLPAFLPCNYIQYGLLNNFQQPLLSGSLVTLMFSNEVYDLKNQKNYIPIPDDEFRGLNLYLKNLTVSFNKSEEKIENFQIEDIRDADTCFEVLYKSREGYFYSLKIDKKSRAEIARKAIKNIRNNGLQIPPQYYLSMNKIVYKSRNDNCLQFMPYNY